MKNSIINRQLELLLTNEHDNVANMANASALLMQTLSDVNWVGFYTYMPNKDELILAPFQGKVACMHIKNGQGVCGKTFANQKTTVVKNVHNFPGHIACDSDSQSEMVIPITKNKIPYGVLDIDSPILDRFKDDEVKELEEFVTILTKHLVIDN